MEGTARRRHTTRFQPPRPEFSDPAVRSEASACELAAATARRELHDAEHRLHAESQEMSALAGPKRECGPYTFQ